MIGPIKLSEIKERLSQALGKNKSEIEAWVDQHMTKVKPKVEHDPNVEEDLLWVLKILREAVKEKKSTIGKSKKRGSQKTPAAKKQIGLAMR